MIALPNADADGGEGVPKGISKKKDTIRSHIISICSSAIFVLLLLLLDTGFVNCAPHPEGSGDPRIDANQLVREVIQNELQAQAGDQTHWRYRELERHNGREELRDVIETQFGEIHRLLAVNREPLTSSENRREDARLQKLKAHPDGIVKQQKKQNEDSEKESQLLQIFPRAFYFQYAGMEKNLVRLSFKPNPHFHPSRREGQVFHHMSGTMWIDAGQQRLAGIDGDLTGEVRFGGGLLGRLDKGGTFSVRLEDVGSGHWGLKSLDIHMKGRALIFKTISVQQGEYCTDYQSVPSHMPLARAVQLLLADSSASAQALHQDFPGIGEP